MDAPRKPRITLLSRLLHQHYAQAVDAAMRDAGFGDIRPSDAKAFPFVPVEGVTVGELAARAGVRKQTMAETVNRLVGAGYLERQPNPRDARSQLVLLTDRGRRARPVAAAAGDRVERQWAELTSPEEVELLRSLLQHLVSALDAASENPPTRG
ncbi:MarR family winged helix-turn-helix transcriptional regulator [Nocardia sp. CDC160]|uniref:MarR family winged helix-turn-helix transcriptional regulator n=1 Tax=Nocardia sp. CDC160 TaxID=3112166 RepID=UPI002DBA2F87|nr:MarR family winged helix-turn-helix transcriptional regulator [Nocardia sp. CDC160]MEC3917290.1 MarR family winged helix-turn-helix transcriptional regulator [Nocardia sp. CDC160]